MKLTKRTQIIIEEGGFRDALYFPINSDITNEEIAELAQERVDNFNESQKIKVVEVEPTKEDLESEQKEIDEQIIQLQTQKSILADKLESVVMVEKDLLLKDRIVDNKLNTSEQDGNIEI